MVAAAGERAKGEGAEGSVAGGKEVEAECLVQPDRGIISGNVALSRRHRRHVVNTDAASAKRYAIVGRRSVLRCRRPHPWIHS